MIMARYGEIALKGRNRYRFEDLLVDNVRRALHGLGPATIQKTYGRVFISDVDTVPATQRLARVFGLVSLSPVWVLPRDMDAIKARAVAMTSGHAPGTFKVQARRSYKEFPYDSPAINRAVGAHVLEHAPGWSVDVHRPDLVINVEVRQEGVFLFSESVPGPGGLPVGMTGRAVLLLSGGIDSPVAGWMALKRGLELAAVHFHSFPYTGERSREKVVDLGRVLAGYAGSINLYINHFTDIQKAIVESCPHHLTVILMRRMMMRLADRIAEREGALALVTGESLGQVASQTLESIVVTNAVAGRPVLRPLISFDKVEIVDRAQAIGTYHISIRPYEDCCTLFVPRHPVTAPRQEQVAAAEQALDMETLIAGSLERTERVILAAGDAEDWQR